MLAAVTTCSVVPVCETPHLGIRTVNAVHTHVACVVGTSRTNWQVCTACHSNVLRDHMYGKLYSSSLKNEVKSQPSLHLVGLLLTSQ